MVVNFAPILFGSLFITLPVFLTAILAAVGATHFILVSVILNGGY